MPDDLALYLHIPFCDVKCAYCDFNSYAGMESLIPAYTDALCQELRLWAPRLAGSRVQTVFFGGGTPSLTPPDQMQAILEDVRDSFDLSANAEISLEANPGTVDRRYLADLRRIGCNRLSLGVQSFDDGELKALDRIHSSREAIEAFDAARAAGFDNVNLDLIYGLEGQTLTRWRANVEQALELRPDHLSLYALTIEEGTALAASIARGLSPAPDPDLQADMYELARDLLAAEGYVHYEISNWALPGRACRHNLVYWRNGRWLGVGAGAHSSLPGLRFSNALSPRGYIHRVQQSLATSDTPPAIGFGSSPDTAGVGARFIAPASPPEPLLAGMPQVVWHEAIDTAVAMSDTAILGLRLLEGLSLSEFESRHGAGLLEIYGTEVQDCIDLGLLSLEGDRLRLTTHGLLLANEVFTRLLPKALAI